MYGLPVVEVDLTSGFPANPALFLEKILCSELGFLMPSASLGLGLEAVKLGAKFLCSMEWAIQV